MEGQYKRHGYGVGITKTIKSLRQENPLFQKRKKDWVRALVEEALARGIIKQTEVRSRKGKIVNVLARGSFSRHGSDPVRLVGGQPSSRSTIPQSSYTRSLQDALHAYRSMIARSRGVPREFILSEETLCRVVRANQNIHIPSDVSHVASAHKVHIMDIVMRQKTMALNARNEVLERLYRAKTPIGKAAGVMKCSVADIAAELVCLLETVDDLDIDCEYFGLTSAVEAAIIRALQGNPGATDRFVAVSAHAEPHLVRLCRLVRSTEQ